MATPTKRRKTNAYNSSPQNVRSLDFFFGKQREGGISEAQSTDSTNQELQKAQFHREANDTDIQALNDEELARKLQLEWNNEDKRNCRPDESETEVSASTAIENEVKGLKDDVVNDNSTPIQSQKEESQKENTNEPIHRNESEKKIADKKRDTLSLQSATFNKDTISSNIPFDESPLTFDPSTYVSDLQEQWAADGGDASYGLLTRCFVLVNSTQSRIKIVDTLVNFLRIIIECDSKSLLPAVSKCSEGNLPRNPNRVCMC